MGANGRPPDATRRPTRADGGETEPDPDRVVVLNPVSGSGDHATEVRSRAAERGFAVRETEGEGDAVRFAREAGERGADVVAAAGGDGTINEVVKGLWEADALDDVALAVVPAGTGNNFANNLGIESIADAFSVIDGGERRRLDLGIGSDRPFVNSCVAGLTANASAETDDEVKSQYGVLAYVMTTLRHVSEFDGLRLAVETEGAIQRPGADAAGADTEGADADGTETEAEADDHEWRGEAMLVLIGNARRFPGFGRRSQANVEDGLQEVTIVEGEPASSVLEEATNGGLLGGDGQLLGGDSGLLDGEDAPITRLRAPALSIRALDEEVRFSLDGEIVETDEFAVETRARALECFVGDAYEPTPER